MNGVFSNLAGILMALFAFGLLIMVHELGHMVAAKRSGVKVEEFWIGMGPQLWAHEFGETKYCLRLLPIGGACVMEGENGEEEGTASERSFAKASRPRRLVILAAGVVMNFITGFVILLFLMPGAQDGRMVVPTLDGFYEGFQHEGADGLMAGDTFLEIDGYRIHQRSDVDTAIQRGAADGEFDILVRRNGEKVLISDLKMRPDVEVDGRMLYGLRFATAEITLPLRMQTAFWESVNLARVIWDSLHDLVTGEVGMDQLSGPIGVTGVMAQTAQISLRSFWYLVAFISINLGVMNLLPIPALDGGRILFLAVEAVRGKPLSPKIEGYVNALGLVLLFGLMIYATGNDVFRLLG
jgi:regulator of sigma E protease